MKKRASSYFRNHPNEVKGTIAGGTIGGAIGTFIGGVGIAAMGTGIGVPAGLALGGLGLLIGNRAGIARDRSVDGSQNK